MGATRGLQKPQETHYFTSKDLNTQSHQMHVIVLIWVPKTGMNMFSYTTAVPL